MTLWNRNTDSTVYPEQKETGARIKRENRLQWDRKISSRKALNGCYFSFPGRSFFASFLMVLILSFLFGKQFLNMNFMSLYLICWVKKEKLFSKETTAMQATTQYSIYTKTKNDIYILNAYLYMCLCLGVHISNTENKEIVIVLKENSYVHVARSSRWKWQTKKQETNESIE